MKFNLIFVFSRTQSGPVSNLRHHQSLGNDQPRPWTDGGKQKPRQLEPLFNAPIGPSQHLIIPKQKGLTGLHLSCNYSGVNQKYLLEPLSKH